MTRQKSSRQTLWPGLAWTHGRQFLMIIIALIFARRNYELVSGEATSGAVTGTRRLEASLLAQKFHRTSNCLLSESVRNCWVSDGVHHHLGSTNEMKMIGMVFGDEFATNFFAIVVLPKLLPNCHATLSDCLSVCPAPGDDHFFPLDTTTRVWSALRSQGWQKVTSILFLSCSKQKSSLTVAIKISFPPRDDKIPDTPVQFIAAGCVWLMTPRPHSTPPAMMDNQPEELSWVRNECVGICLLLINRTTE